MSNINTKTKIPFGYISADSLDSDTVQELMYGPQAVNLTYRDCRDEFIAQAKRDFEEGQEELANEQAVETGEDFIEEEFDEENANEDFSEQYQGDEETIEGQMDCPGYGKVSYCTSWLGGALNFWIFESPFSTDKARRASPCVPNAGILDTLDGSYTSYDVPADWRREA